MNLIKQIAYLNPCYRAGRTITPKGLMLHSVGTPQPSAAVFARSWNDSAVKVCVHAFVQADGTVYQLLPWHWRGWHCGGDGNNTHIGVEMTEPSQIRYSSGATFVCTDVAAAREHVRGCYDTAVELFALLCRQYRLDPLTQICSHAEGRRLGIASNHSDPEHLWRQLGLPYTMDGFRRDVKAKLAGTSAAAESVYTRWQFVCDIQREIGVGVDGVPGPVTLGATPTRSATQNYDHGAVRYLQKCLYTIGYIEVGAADGIAGPKFTQAVRNFQRDSGCVVDGELTAGAKTWRKLLGME